MNPEGRAGTPLPAAYSPSPATDGAQRSARPPALLPCSVFLATALLLLGCGREPSTPPGLSSTPPAPGTTSASQPTPSAPWFQEVAASSGIAFRHSSGHTPGSRHLMPEINCGGVALLDFDNDGLLDVFCVNGGFADPSRTNAPGHKLYHNLGNWRFEDVTGHAGIGTNTAYGMGVATADFDNDGWTDIYLLNLRGNVLYRNRGDGTFEDVTARAGVAGREWSSSAAFLDYDGDGHLDLFVANYIHWTLASEVDCFSRGGVPDYCSPLSYRAPAMDRLYHSRGDGTFEDVSVAMGLDKAFGNGLGVATGDFDHDGWVDIFVSNDAMPNQLWLNHGGKQFEESATPRGCALNVMGIPRAGMGTVAVDLLNRGWLDLFVTHLAGEGNGLFLNHDGMFTDSITRRGPMAPSRPYTGFGVGFRDLDHDGELDLFVANGRARLGARDLDPADPYAEPSTLLRGLGNIEFEEVQPAGGTQPPLIATARGAAFGDLDNDGAEDVVVIQKDGPVRILRNIVGQRGAWIGLDVRDARGLVARNAMVRVECGGRTQSRQVQPNEGYGSSNDHRIVFGLGKASQIDRVTVRWPGGHEESFGPLPAGKYHRVAPAKDP